MPQANRVASSAAFDEVHESNRQYVSMWRSLAQARSLHADTSDRSGLSFAWADSRFTFWNAIFLTEELHAPEGVRRGLREAAKYMRSKRHSGLVYVCKDHLGEAARSELAQILLDEGLHQVLPLTGMVGAVPVPAVPSTAPALQFLRVTDEAALQVYADINSESYGLPLDAGRAGLAGSGFWKETAQAYIGYVNDIAVSTAAAIVNHGQLYLALVATRPEAQRQGFGEATVRHVLRSASAATGLTRTTLHATEAGRPVYERLGYRATARFLAFGLSS